MTEKIVQNCGKCGLCLNACPVYKILKEEQVSPRAKLHLIKAYDNNDMMSSSLLKEIISKCLMCGSCSAACPSGINHYSKFMEMRKKMVETQGETPAIKSLIYLLAREYRLKFGAGLARTGQKFMPEIFTKTYKLGNIPLKNFPELNKAPLRKTVDTIINPDKKIVGKVIYFTGCATNYLYDDTGIATIGILKHMGYQVIIPKNQTCCSIPLLFHGAEKKAHKNIFTNIKALNKYDADYIIVDCSTCGEALKNEYPYIVEKLGKDTAGADKIASKVIDILTFIESRFDSLEFDPDFPDKILVTYHAPCHSKNSFKANISAEKILEKLPFITYKRTSDIDECCGGGGTFFYEFPDVSKQMVDKKIENAKSVQVTHWATDCPVCRLNLAGNLNEHDNLKVLHPVSLIYRALKAKRS